MFKNISISFFIFLFVCIPAMVISVPVVAVLLLTSWDGRTTIFGNAKWGRANDHFAYPTKGYWQEFNWLVLRNPVNNLAGQFLGVPQRPYELIGDENIGDKIAGGFYAIHMPLEDGPAWEYYWIKPYNILDQKRCIRARIGWKIKDNIGKAAFVFAINPWKKYLGK